MERRAFIRKAALGASGGGALAACAGEGGGPAAQTNAAVRWGLVSSYPRSLDTLLGAAETLSARVAALTDDRFQIRVYPAGEIVPYDQVLDACRQGTVQCGHTASYYFIGKNPALAFDLFEEEAAADAGYANVYRQWKRFRDEAQRWFSTDERAYGDFIAAHL